MENAFILNETSKYGIENSHIPHTLSATYAQCGEDIIVAGLLFAQLTKSGRPWNSVFYIEIGANHPISTSNTYLLYNNHGASGILVEPNPALHQAIASVRPRDRLVKSVVLPEGGATVTLHIGNAHELSSVRRDHIDSFGGFGGLGGVSSSIDVVAIGINDLLAQAGQREIDFLSIDCEGIDYELMRAIDFETYKPLVIQCEPSEHFSQGNRAKMINLLESRSYRLVARTEVNLIFLRHSM
jgi:FkbM family methyltransferase